LICKVCEGSGRVVFYEQKVRKWDYNITKGEVYHPKLHCSKFPKFKINDNLKRFKEDEHLTDNLSGNFYVSEPDYFQSIYTNIFERSFRPEKVNIDNNGKILFQKVKTNSIPAFLLNYEFEGENYSLLVFEKNNTVYEENGPIEKVKSEIKSKGKQYFKRKNFGASIKQLNKAKEMDPGGFDIDLSSIFNKVEKKIRSSYWVGSFIGLFFFGYLLLMTYLSGFHDENSLNSWIKSKQISKEFIFGSATGFFLLYLLIALPIVSFQNKYLYTHYGIKINPELLRFVVGFFCASFVSVIATIIVFLIHKLGVIEPIGTFVNSFFE